MMINNEKKLNILVDYSFVKKKPPGPVSIHIFLGRLLKGLNEDERFNPTILLWKGMEEYIDFLAGYKTDKIVVDGNMKVTPSVKLDRLLMLSPITKLLRERQTDVVITPEFSPYAFFFPKKYHQHLIIHDLIQIHRSNNKRSVQLYYKYMMKWGLFRVAHVITISQQTHKLVKEWGHRDSDIVYNSIPFDFQTAEEPVNCVIGKKYILDVNRFNEYKNPETLVKAMALLKEKIPHLLYFKGYSNDPSYMAKLKETIEELHLENKIIIDTSYRSEGELRYLYTHADLFVTPSWEEGFGYTPIEAAVLKTPILVSNIPTLCEVTKGRVPMFNPHSPEELASKILSIINTPPTEVERTALADFYLHEYSLKNQIDQLAKVIYKNLGIKTIHQAPEAPSSQP